jgi:hypothetical protein
MMTLSELQNLTVGYLQFLKSEDILNQVRAEEGSGLVPFIICPSRHNSQTF